MGCIFIAELSTPFVSLGKIFMQVGEEMGLGSGNPTAVCTPFLSQVLLHHHWVTKQLGWGARWGAVPQT